MSDVEVKSEIIGNKTLSIADDVKEIADSVILKERLGLENIKIQYMKIYPSISKTVAGKCIRANNELKFFSDADFIVQMSGDLWDKLDSETKYVLTYHELLHILCITNKNDEAVYKLRDHDIKDFSRIITKYGTDWFDNLKAIMSSVYDLDPEAEDNITA